MRNKKDPNIIKEYQKRYKEEHKERIKLINKLNYENNKEKRLENNKKRYLKNKDKISETQKKYNKVHREEIKKQKEFYKQTLKGRFNKIRSSARERGFVFELTIEMYEKHFYKKLCFYCGAISTGIDRLDSEKGYIQSNVIPCCKCCNKMKLNFSIEMFVEKVIKVYNKITNENEEVKVPTHLTKVESNNQKYKQSSKGRFLAIKSGAKKRKMEFELTWLEYEEEFYKKSCFYCGDTSTGIDRLDNKKGYIQNNMLACCEWCNKMKLNYSFEFFINQIISINENLFKNDVVVVSMGGGGNRVSLIEFSLKEKFQYG
jgi:hypothetical protein